MKKSKKYNHQDKHLQNRREEQNQREAFASLNALRKGLLANIKTE